MTFPPKAVVKVAATAAITALLSPFVRAQLPQAVGTWGDGGASAVNRTGSASVALRDGRSVILGGVGADGVLTDTVVVYDPVNNSFTTAGQLLNVRVAHSAALVDDDRVAVIGGSRDGVPIGDIEVFDLVTGTSQSAGQMAQPRTGHASTRLQDGTVLIVGGTGAGGQVLASAEIFDPVSGTTTLAASLMQRSRSGASATTLVDGRVLVVGGNDGAQDLQSAELYYPGAQTFALTDTLLGVPRSGHTAVLLPNNGSVLIAGGTFNGAAQVGSDLFLPAQFPDPFSWGVGTFAATGNLAAARASGFGGPTAVDGYAYIAGGGAANSERYRFATVKTDRDDYAPGELAIITGSGWEPNSQVTLTFQEDPAVHDDYVITAPTDSEGNLYWDQWAPEVHDLNVRFYLLARQGSRVAQTTFTDAGQVTQATVAMKAADCSTNQSVFTPGQTACASVTVDTPNDNAPLADFYIQWYAPGFVSGTSTPVRTTLKADVLDGSTHTDTFNTTGQPTGTWTVLGCKNPNAAQGNRCSTDNVLPGSTTFTLSAAQPSFSISDVSLNEGNAGTTAFTFTVTKTGAGSASVDFATSPAGTNPASSGACPGADYQQQNGTLSFATADTSKTVTINVCGDVIDEPNETFQVTLSNPVGATISDDTGSGTIQDDDSAATLSIDDVTLAEGNAGATAFQFTVTKSGATAFATSVDFATSAGATNPATAGACGGAGIDYASATGTLNFAAADETKTITVNVCGDSTQELNETFKVTLSGASSTVTISDGDGVGTINNDDAPPAFSINDVTVAEGDSGTTNFVFTVTKTGATDLASSVEFATSAGATNPATAGSGTCAAADYQTAGGTLSFAAADPTTKTITVLVCGDEVYELNQTFKVTLSNTTNATLSDDEGVGTINNDDDPPSLSIDDVTQAEGDGGTTNFVFTVTKSGSTEVDAAVNFATAATVGTPATAGAGTCAAADYQSKTGSLTLLAADTSKTITVLVCGDDVDENSETFVVNLTTPTHATMSDSQGLGTITDDDATPVVTPSSAAQTGQYSDDITDITITATDDDTAGSSLTASSKYKIDTGSGFGDFISGLPSNLSLPVTSTVLNSRTWTLEHDLQVQAGTYVIRVTVSDGTNTRDTDITITVKKEDAAVIPDAGNLDAYPASGGTPIGLTLKFVVREKNPEPTTNGGAKPGDITKAGLTVSLNGAAGGNISGSCSPALSGTPPSYSAYRTFTCTFGAVPVDAYEIQANVTGNFYVGSLVDTVAVYDPNAGFVTGGGKLFFAPTGPDHEGVSFGLVFNFTGKNKTLPRGNLVVIRHLANGDICRIKSNLIDAPAVVNNTASFSGRGNYVCTKPDGTTYDGVGNQTILGWVEDNGQGSTATAPDRFWINVNAPNSKLAMGGNGPANAQPLTGGNIQVPQPSSGR